MITEEFIVDSYSFASIMNAHENAYKWSDGYERVHWSWWTMSNV